MKTLFIVGAQRSGSTYLYTLLDDHPQVSMAQPVRPEPKFFLDAQRVSLGKASYENTYFANRKAGSLYLGEKSTSYIESEVVARRLFDFAPDARILMILRDPVLRAYSNYRFSVAHSLEPLSFAAAIDAEPERIKLAQFATSVTPFAYRQRGHYIDYIKLYQQVFDPAQIDVLIFEELAGNLDAVQALYRRLGIDDSVVPDSLSQVVNAATVQETDQRAVFRALAMGYRDSISNLERLLGRQITAWRAHHEALIDDRPE